MRRLRLRFVLPALVAGVAITSLWASEHLCEAPICPAFKLVGNVMKTQIFVRGDVVSTGDGWLVSSAHGWIEID